MTPLQTNIKIIGLGSPHGDDQAGWEVIRLLQQHKLPDSIELLILDRPGAALINHLQGCDQAILIDACDADWPAGHWQQLSLEGLLDCAELQGGNSHQLGITDSLQLAIVTGAQLPDINCFAIQISQIEPMAPINEAILSSCAQIASELQAHLSGRGAVISDLKN